MYQIKKLLLNERNQQSEETAYRAEKYLPDTKKTGD
jgi:hypothetical protein